MAIDWTPWAEKVGVTGTAEYRVEDDGLVRWRGVLTFTIAPTGTAVYIHLIPLAARALVSVLPLYIDWNTGERSIYDPSGDALFLGYNAGYAIGATIDLHPLTYQGPIPPAATPAPRTNTPATFTLAGITFNTGVPDALGVKWYASIIDGADSPEQAVEVEPRTGAHGAYFAGGWYGRRPLLLSGQVVAENLDALKAARGRLMVAADLLRVLGVLEVNDPGAAWRAEVYRADRPRFVIETGYYATFTLPLASPDPLRYGLVENAVSVNLSAVSAGVTADVVADVSAGGGTSSQLVAVNNGTTATPVRLELSGPLTNPVITHDNTGSVIRLAIVLLAGDKLIIEPTRRTVTLGGETRRGLVVGRPGWFELVPGANVIRLAASSTDPAGSLAAYWRDARI